MRLILYGCLLVSAFLYKEDLEDYAESEFCSPLQTRDILMLSPVMNFLCDSRVATEGVQNLEPQSEYQEVPSYISESVDNNGYTFESAQQTLSQRICQLDSKRERIKCLRDFQNRNLASIQRELRK
jgi:hypothetical protein